MLECNRSVKKKIKLLSRGAALMLVVVCVVMLLSQTAFAKNTYVINDGGRVLFHTTYATDPADVLTEAGLELGEDDTYTTESGLGVSEITVQRKQTVTVIQGSKALQVNTYGETVESLLNRMNVTLGKEEVVSVPMDTATYDGMVLTISRAIETRETYTTQIPYETTYCYDASLDEGEEVILTAGTNGQLLCTATVYYVDGLEISRTVTSEVVTRQPVNAVIAVGTYIAQADPVPMPTEPEPTAPKATEPVVTKPAVKEPAVTEPAPTQPEAAESTEDTPSDMPVIGDGIITTPTGEVLTYTQKLDVVATAYSCNGESGYTYSGTPARVGAIAVDPNYIPLGTRMYIVSNDGQYIYGIATAEDIGGAIKGYKVDLYFDTFDECWTFGVRDCTVYILG